MRVAAVDIIAARAARDRDLIVLRRTLALGMTAIEPVVCTVLDRDLVARDSGRAVRIVDGTAVDIARCAILKRHRIALAVRTAADRALASRIAAVDRASTTIFQRDAVACHCARSVLLIRDRAAVGKCDPRPCRRILDDQTIPLCAAREACCLSAIGITDLRRGICDRECIALRRVVVVGDTTEQFLRIRRIRTVIRPRIPLEDIVPHDDGGAFTFPCVGADEVLDIVRAAEITRHVT